MEKIKTVVISGLIIYICILFFGVPNSTIIKIFNSHVLLAAILVLLLAVIVYIAIKIKNLFTKDK